MILGYEKILKYRFDPYAGRAIAGHGRNKMNYGDCRKHYYINNAINFILWQKHRNITDII